MSIVDHLDKLRSFKVIADAGTLREAATRLNLSQPSLTRLIQTLEGASNQSLFHRSRSGVELSESGKVLYDFSVLILKNLEDTEERMRAPQTDMSGHLQVGSYESLAEYLWPEFLPLLKKAHPHLKVTIRTSDEFVNQRALEAGQLDLLVDAEPRWIGDFTSWVLYEDRFNFYGKKGSVDLNLDPKTIGDLPLVYCPNAFDHENKKILQHLEEQGYFFKEKIELDSFTSVATFAEKGAGLGVMPQRLAASRSDAKKLSHVTMGGFSAKGFGSHSIYATVRSSSADDKRLRALIKLLREWFKKA